MRKLISELKILKDGDINQEINKRISSFEKLRMGSNSDIFRELCFCLLTANYTAEGGIRIQNSIGDGVLHYTEKRLARTLKMLGHRFPNARASYIRSAQRYRGEIVGILDLFSNDLDLREWLVKNIKGFGYKEASHFMRNIGYKNVAIIDFHIIDLLSRYGLISRPKTITKSKYFEIERILDLIARKGEMSLGELDLYLWFMETGKILK
ncbi:MAG: N-glycosylase [Candidatus Spechtbacteria bacterium RIFCSPHIGHO2_02_FULL_43_15b]|uniref:8-oxoguanine DNA glycosylase/AP lyase n=1 Tax=Candidatus Spechtbacteria bacterium RIFCSPHIGHO2_01_FULL_43_30 TaxID=1802158 RepID=A0A1G2H4K2_9BACT|nr:MAG: N-glycosylase [Candidatus Spechtbacteria bacterium RIFCSPHIGHO2_01_FULL_43_30]OGZ58874.1 MAG: N-glycosylase [Candidatus Spechtbacteria bacterium RIFCSPHIGHO2_02_FULL_43_15b]